MFLRDIWIRNKHVYSAFITLTQRADLVGLFVRLFGLGLLLDGLFVGLESNLALFTLVEKGIP